MNGRLAARITGFLALWALLGPTATAWSAPRRVAIVNVATDQRVGANAAAALRRDLDGMEELAAVPSGELARALEEPLPEQTPVERALAEATQSLERAGKHQAAFNLGLALSELAKTEERLAALAYDARVRGLLAELNIRRGAILMGKPDRGGAREAFRLARALAPERATLDAAIFDPVVTQTYDAAGAARQADARVEITTAYDGAALYVDGVRAEAQPVKVTPGLHVITATFPEHRPAGTVVDVTTGQTRSLRLDLWPQSSIERATTLRRGLAGTPLAPAFQAAAQAVAGLTASEAVIFLRDTRTGGIEVAVFDQRNSTSTPWTALADTQPEHVFAVLLPRAQPPTTDLRLIPTLPPPPTPAPWYKQRRWQAIVGGGAVVTIAGILVFALTGDNGAGNTGGSFGGSDIFE